MDPAAAAAPGGESEGGDADSTSGLDDWGWDPCVDAFLRALVREAPLGPFGVVDFAWVSSRFLETLEPSEDQIVAAVQRFNPTALEERWLYLQDVPEEALPPDLFGEEEDAEEAVGADGSSPVDAGGGASSSCSSGARAAAEGPDGEADGDAEGAAVPARARVLHAMQSYLFGLPRPGAREGPSGVGQGPRPFAPPPRRAAESAEDAGRQGAALRPPSRSGAAVRAVPSSGSAASGKLVADGSGRDSTSLLVGSDDGEAEDEEAESDATCWRFRAQHVEDNPSAPPGAPVRRYQGNEALRRCLDELRWHGEALRQCAAGNDAARLCCEAAARRRALLWSLGVAPETAL